jgi:hypothetical protein
MSKPMETLPGSVSYGGDQLGDKKTTTPKTR